MRGMRWTGSLLLSGFKARQALLTLEQASEPGLDDDLARGGWLAQPSLSPGLGSWEPDVIATNNRG